jgi:hypothetical protein
VGISGLDAGPADGKAGPRHDRARKLLAAFYVVVLALQHAATLPSTPKGGNLA